MFSRVLTLKKLEYEQNKLGEFQQSEDLYLRKCWLLIRSHKDSIQIIHNIDKGGVTYSTPDELKQMWRDSFERLFNEQTNEGP